MSHTLLPVITNTRNFLRDFSAIKARARRGQTVRIKDKEGEFIFAAAVPRKSLLGAAKGRLVVHTDLSQPTLSNEEWRPSL